MEIVLKEQLRDKKRDGLKINMNSIPKLYDFVYDKRTNKKGTVVYIFEGDLNKNIPETYLFEPSDWSFDPEERYDYELELIK